MKLKLPGIDQAPKPTGSRLKKLTGRFDPYPSSSWSIKTLSNGDWCIVRKGVLIGTVSGSIAPADTSFEHLIHKENP